MQRIPQYVQQTSVGGAPAGVPLTGVNRGALAFGEALRDVGQVATALKVREKNLAQQAAEQQASVAANDELMAARSEWAAEFRKRQTEAPPGAANFTGSMLEAFDADVEQRLERAQSPTSKAYLKQRLAEVRLGLFDEATRFEATQAHDFKVGQLSSSLDKARTALDFRPDDFQQIAGEQIAGIAASGLPAQTQQALVDASTDKLAAAAVEGLIRRDPRGALKQLDTEGSKVLSIQALSADDRRRLRASAEAEVRALDAQNREAQSLARAELADRVEDAQASYVAGLDVADPPTRADFLAAYPADKAREAERAFNAFAAIQQVGGDLKLLPRMAPAEQAALLASRLPKKTEGAADALKAYSVLEQRARELNTELKQDSALYAATYDPATQAAANALYASPSPATAQAYAQASAAAQMAHGVTEPKLLTDSQAHQMSERLKLTGNGADVVNAVQQESAMWGRYWPQAMAEAAPKLNPAVQVIALGMDPVPAARLATVAALPKDELAGLAPANIKRTDVDDAIRDELAPFVETMAGQAGAEEQLSRLSSAATALAFSYIAGGEKLGNAAERAAREVILDRYTVRDGLRFPMGVDADLVRNGLRTLQPEIKALGWGGETRWRTMVDDSGLELEDAASNRPLTRKDGTPVAFTFAELQQKAVNRREDIRRRLDEAYFEQQDTGPQ